MPSRQSTARKLKSQPKQQLNDSEVQRIAEKLAVALEYDGQNIALLTLLFDYLESLHRDPLFSGAVYTIKKHLFVGTNAADNAQEQFQADAFKNRGKLLQWPYEQKGVA